MGKSDACEICGGTDSKLVDGFYYCLECGTQDANVRDTAVEQTVLADGTVAFAARMKFAVKIKEGVKMSREWYKWHTYNYILAGLTEQLVALGAAPSLKMKVLWIWTRYIKMFQRKGEMGPLSEKTFNELLDEAESESEADAGDKDEPGEIQERGEKMSVGRVNKYLLASILVFALNLDRSSIQPPTFCRLVLYKLLGINETRRLVPDGIHLADVESYDTFQAVPLSTCSGLGAAVGRLQARLALGPAVPPDLEAVLAAQLRDLCLPPDFRYLVLALMAKVPIPFLKRHHLKLAKRGTDRLPDYEVVVMAHVVVALKLCFGLDDKHETRLSDAVDNLNHASGHPRAYINDSTPTERLFSFRDWCVYLQFRTHALCAGYGPLAWERNRRAGDYAYLEHFEDFTERAHLEKKERTLLGDEVTMDVVNRIPFRGDPGVAPLADLKPCMAAAAPHAALAELMASKAADPKVRRLLAEDFTKYSLRYAYRDLALPHEGGNLVGGLAEAGKTFRRRIDFRRHGARSDPGLVHVRNCGNANWLGTGRPEVILGEDEGRGTEGETAEETPEPDDLEPETFDEETSENIFDDDFLDVEIKEETEAPECRETKEELVSNADHHDDSYRGNGDLNDDLDFDSDDDSPRFDPTTFNREETIKTIMTEAYVELGVRPPVRFRQRDKVTGADRKERARGPPRRRRPGDVKRLAEENVQDLLTAYYDNLRNDALHQISERVRSFVNDTMFFGAPPTPGPDDVGDAIPDRIPSPAPDLQVSENTGDETDDDDPPDEAEDPVYRGDAGFDEKTHDPRLYVALPAAPRPAHHDHTDHTDDDVARILDEKISVADALRGTAAASRLPAADARPARLVGDPDAVPSFGYWFKRYPSTFRKHCRTDDGAVRELDESLPRGFRFLLFECAAMLRAGPAHLYCRVMDVEAALLAALAPPGSGERRRHRRRSDNERYAERRRAERSESVSAESDMTRKDDAPRAPKRDKRKSRRKSESASEIGVKESVAPRGTVAKRRHRRKSSNERHAERRRAELESVAESDARREDAPSAPKRSRRKSRRKSESASEIGVEDSEEPARGLEGVGRRRSGRLRTRAAADPFWR